MAEIKSVAPLEIVSFEGNDRGHSHKFLNDPNPINTNTPHPVQTDRQQTPITADLQTLSFSNIFKKGLDEAQVFSANNTSPSNAIDENCKNNIMLTFDILIKMMKILKDAEKNDKQNHEHLQKAWKEATKDLSDTYKTEHEFQNSWKFTGIQLLITSSAFLNLVPNDQSLDFLTALTNLNIDMESIKKGSELVAAQVLTPLLQNVTQERDIALNMTKTPLEHTNGQLSQLNQSQDQKMQQTHSQRAEMAQSIGQILATQAKILCSTNA